MKKQVAFAHGFGVQKDDRGLFTDIAAACPEHDYTFVDLNDVDAATGNLWTPPLEEQARRFKNHIATLPRPVDMVIAHSMGCLVACLADLPPTVPMVFLTPPAKADLKKTIASFQSREGTMIDLNGESILSRKDGTKTIVPASFWISKEKNDPMIIYKSVAGRTIDFVIANQDDVLGDTLFDSLSADFKLHYLDGDHNFSGVSRAPFLAFIKGLI